MQSWRFLQLEPSALRSPDDFRDSARFGPTGAHLPNALMRIGRHAEVANKLAELIPGIVDVAVDSDEARQQRTVHVCMNNGERFAASSLSDGTLRFLALAVLACDPLAHGLVCLEEPENGIHPERVPEILKLVHSLADEAASEDETGPTSLRQVIINTHSPLVVSALDDTDLLWADTRRYKGREWIHFKPLADTWRSPGLLPTQLISKGELKAYLTGGVNSAAAPAAASKPRKVLDHFTPDLFGVPSASSAS
jgi:predicted ATPase